MRKVVILNASPRKDGNISQMLNIMGDTLFEKGTEVTIIDVCKLEFRPCIGCMKCRSAHDCVMPEDDAKRILRMVQECNALVVGSPCYWGNMTGQLKMLFDRWVYGMMDHSERDYPIPLLKGKRAVILRHALPNGHSTSFSSSRPAPFAPSRKSFAGADSRLQA